ncbi:MAG: hypothetical protein AB1805_02490 [Nitrospirota bacterium]
MNTGPYSSEAVQQHLEERFVTLKTQVSWDKPSALMKHFVITWTPTLLIHDKAGRVHHGMVGFVPEDDLLAHLAFGHAKVVFDAGHLDRAIEELRAVIDLHPSSAVTPEAVFYLGIAEYKRFNDATALRRAYDMLTARYPESEWARRARPYEHIPSYAEI